MYPEPEHDPVRKTKRNRHETECAVKRHGYGCGICGSLNVVYQGVIWCPECGAEIEWLSDNSAWHKDKELRPCDCITPWTYKGRTLLMFTRIYIDFHKPHNNYSPITTLS